MRMRLFAGLLLAALLLLASVATVLAQIPDDVDFHAYQTTADNNWVVTRNVRFYEPTYWLDSYKVKVMNCRIAEFWKSFYVRVTYSTLPSTIPDLTAISAEDENTPIAMSHGLPIGNTVTWSCVLKPQPSWEQVIFPTTDYHMKTNGVTKVEVATYCTAPEPGSLLTLTSGFLGLAGVAVRRRRRRA